MKRGGHHFYVKQSSVTTNPASPERRDRVWRLALELLPHASFASSTTFAIQPKNGDLCSPLNGLEAVRGCAKVVAALDGLYT